MNRPGTRRRTGGAAVDVLPPAAPPAPAAPATSTEPTSGRPAWLSPHPYALGTIIVLAAAVYLKLSLLKMWRGNAGVNDLVIFDQAIKNYSKFRGPISPARGMTPTPPKEMVPTEHFTLLSDHMSPINMLLAPLYWVNNSPANLLFAQAVLIAVAAWPLWIFTRRALGTTAAYLVVITYVTSGPVAQVIGFDFHEVAFAPLFTAIMYERFQAGRKLHVAIAVVGIMLIKEDMGLFLAGFGLALLFYKGWRRFAGGVIAGGLGWMLFATHVLLPFWGGDPNLYWAYGQLGNDIPSTVSFIIRHPIETLKIFGTPDSKLTTLTGMLTPLLWVPILSPLLLPAVPLFAERMLGNTPNWWTSEWHYNGFMIIPLLAGGVDTLRRLKNFLDKRKLPRVAWAVPVVWATAAMVMTFTTIHKYPLGMLNQSWFHGRDGTVTSAEFLFPYIPDGAMVEAPQGIGPLLTSRTTVLLNRGLAPHAPWVLVDTSQTGWPYHTPEEAAALIPSLTADGYKIIDKRDKMVLLAKQ